MHLYHFTHCQCLLAVFLWCVHCYGCIHCSEGEECLTCNFKERDELRWVSHKWDSKVQGGKILHPTLLVVHDELHNHVASDAQATTSSPCALSPTLLRVESLLCGDWERPPDVMVPISGSQQYKLEALHFKDIHEEYFMTYGAQN